MLTKHCPTCDAIKPIAAFFFRDRARRRPQSQCKECTNQYKRDWYAENRGRHTAVSEAAKRRRIASNVRGVRDYLAEHPCVDCGEADVVVLEFDHVRGEKLANISKLVRDGSWHAIVEEIAKCDVRCANCHRRRTASVGGWYNSYT